MGKTYNVVDEYDWTSLPSGSSARSDAPKVYVQSYEVNTNQLYNTYEGYVSVIKNFKSVKQFYDELYKSENSDFFLFPFFDNNIRAFGNTYYDNLGNSLGASADSAFKQGVSVAVDVKNVVQNRGSTSLDLPKHYQFDNNDGPLTVTFPLYNTLSDSYENNRELVNVLTKINRPTRIDSVTMTPPRIYKVLVPGYRLIRWAYCSNFSVDLLGTKRMIGENLIPEGYVITMSFTSLTIEHSEFVDGKMS